MQDTIWVLKIFLETTSRCGSPNLGAGLWGVRIILESTSTLYLDSDYLTFLVHVLEDVSHRVYDPALSLTM